jgi:hypothetical protein
MNFQSRKMLAFMFAFVLVAMLGGVLLWIGSKLKLDGLETQLPTIVIVGVFALLMSLTIVALSFSILGLADKNQALALPEGSVRAVIALMLVVLFAIISIFLYNNLASTGSIQNRDMTQAELDVFQQAGNAVILLRQPIPEKAPDGSSQLKVFYENRGSAAAQDFAKQLLVLLGTLVTAVSSFYFGANSVAGAVAGVSKVTRPSQPRLSATDPRELTRDGQLHDLRIIGEFLGDVTTVKLVLAGQEIVATQVVPGENQVTCKVQADTTRAAGKWDVVVGTVNSQATLAAYLELK